MPAHPRSTPSASASTWRPASAACGRCSTRGTRCASRARAACMPMTVPMLMPNGAGGRGRRCTSAPAPYARTVVSACASSTESIVERLRAPAAGPRRRRHRRRHRRRRSTRCTIASFAAMQALSQAQRRPGDTPRARTASTATGSSWARARPPSCSRPRSTPSPAAPRSTPSSSAAASPTTRTTSPLPSPRASARRARCGWRSSRPARRSTTSRTSTRTRPVTPVGDIAEYKALLQRLRRPRRTRSRSRRRRPRPGTCSAAPARSRRSSRSSPCATGRRRPRSTSPTQDPEIPLASSDPPIAARRRPAARDQQLVRLRRAQRRRRVPHRLITARCHARRRPRRSRSGGVCRVRRRFAFPQPGILVLRASVVAPQHRLSLLQSSRALRQPRRVSRPCGARRRGRHRSRGGTARARRPRPRPARRAARGAVRTRRRPRPPSRSGCGLRRSRRCPPSRSGHSGCRDPACAASGRRRCGAWDPRVTSKRRCSQPRIAVARAAPVPAAPSQ